MRSMVGRARRGGRERRCFIGLCLCFRGKRREERAAELSKRETRKIENHGSRSTRSYLSLFMISSLANSSCATTASTFKWTPYASKKSQSTSTSSSGCNEAQNVRIAVRGLEPKKSLVGPKVSLLLLNSALLETHEPWRILSLPDSLHEGRNKAPDQACKDRCPSTG